MRRAFPPALVLIAGLLLGGSLTPAAAQSALDSAGRHSRVVVHPHGPRDVELLRSLDVDHMHGDDNGITVVLSHADVARLRAAGVDVDVEVAELERFYEARAVRGMEEFGAKPSAALQGLGNFRLGSVGGYYTFEELSAELERMRALFPALAGSVESIGETHERRPILAIRISARPASDQTVPEAIFTALHHAREPAGMMSLVYSMWTLLEGYGVDPEITYLLDNRALWFIPMVNPDGYVRNATRFPNGGGLWRKNMRGNGDSAVDLNRNYGPQEFWAHAIGGSSSNILADNYRGPEPFSEPETRAIRDFCLRHRFGVALNHHTFSNLFIQPDEIPTISAGDSVYYRIATRALASLAGYAPGNSRITVGYAARGTAEDWMYAFGRSDQEHTFSWTPESGNGEDEFWPSPLRIEPICAANHRMNMGIAWAAGAAPIITARSWRAGQSGTVVRVTVTNVGRAPMTMPASLSLTGGAPVDVPPLAPSEALTFELPVPGSLGTVSSEPRPMIGITLGYESARMRDSIAPIVHPVETVFTENFEVGIGRWTTGVEWGLETTSEHTRVASDSPEGSYSERPEPNELTLRDPISLAGYTAAELFFDASYAVEGRNHVAFVQVLSEGELEWRDADCEELQLPFESASPIRNRFRGDMRAWRRYRVKLDEFVGSRILVRFVVAARNSQFHYTFDGLRVDDVEVVAARPFISSADADARAQRALSVSPNPFDTRLLIELGEIRSGTTIDLYDALGERVRSAPGAARISLETDDLPAGAYAVVARRGGEVVGRKVVIRR
jgi:carboxypeptidase T